jgi:hypothetical protein
MGPTRAGSRTPADNNAVLVAGVYVATQPNRIAHVIDELSRSAEWRVEQRWVAVGAAPAPDHVAAVTVDTVDELIPKFTLLNRILAGVHPEQYAFLIVCDDDIYLPHEFLDRYLRLVRDHEFALAQPARTHDSYIDHPFVEQLDGLLVRHTRFVEIGPVVSFAGAAMRLLLPFDESSAMGWGYDLVWPCAIESAGLKMGIVDAVPVGHSVRRPVAQYKHGTADRVMRAYLEHRRHLSQEEAFFIVESYA